MIIHHSFRAREAAVGSLLVIAFAISGTACDEGSRLQSPTAPRPTEGAIVRLDGANYVGEATVVSWRADEACGWDPGQWARGRTVYWYVEIHGGVVRFYEDVDNSPTDGIPYTSTLEGREFAARYQVDSPRLHDCQFREASITGEFSEGFESFEALEVLSWGIPEDQATVERTWSVRRLE